MLSSAVPRVRHRRSTGRVPAASTAYALLEIAGQVVRRDIVDFAGAGLGLRLDVNDALDVGSRVDRIRFVLPVGAPIMASGVVRHVCRLEDGAATAGFSLDGLTGPDRHRLTAWVRGQLPPRSGERRFATEAGGTSVDLVLHDGRVRTRPVMSLTTEGCEIGLIRLDADLRRGADIATAIVRLGDTTILSVPAEIAQCITHRGRPVRAVLAWPKLEPAVARRLVQVLASTAAPRTR